MTLEELGYNKELEVFRKENNLLSFVVGRVISEHKERYVVKTEKAEYESEIIGNLRFSAKTRADFPAVGDWVAISEYDKNKALIYSVFPRKTVLERQAIGKQGEKQIIAANIDFAIIMQAVDRDFNMNRLERYLAICNNSKISPIIILNKIDLLKDNELVEIVENIQKRLKNVPLFSISNITLNGFNELNSIFIKGKTYCLIGSSGVGKSTFLNNLAKNPLMKTNDISSSTKKGKHTTTHRELFILENGAIFIDNPGIREVGITDTGAGIQVTFDKIVELSGKCKFKDCTHTNETGCAVIKAVEKGEIDKNSYYNYLKMEKERIHFEQSALEKRKKDKDFGKMLKNFKKDKKLLGNT